MITYIGFRIILILCVCINCRKERVNIKKRSSYIIYLLKVKIKSTFIT